MLRLACLAALSALAAVAAPATAKPTLTKPPRLVHFEEAEYPPDKKEAGITATVVLSLEIDATGAVTRVEVVESAGPDFDAAARAAAAKFLFEPAEVDGVPAPVLITYSYHFTITEEEAPQPPQVNLEGTVLERFSKVPLAGVTVRLPGLGLETTTDSGGRFAFTDLPPGTHAVELTGEAIIPVTTEEVIAAETRRVVTYWVEEQLDEAEDVDEEIVVRASRLKRDAADFHIEARAARKVAGTQGDTLKVVHNLPGVARSSLGSGQIVVWGSAPADTRVYIDGVEIPALYHLGGLRSIISSELVGGLDLVPGAYGAAWGRGLGGLVTVESRALPPQGTHGHVAADLLDASAHAAVAGGRARGAVAARQSHLDRLLEGALGTEVGEFFPLPAYRDAIAKVEIDLREGEALSLVALGASDRLTRQVPSDDPALTRSEREELDTLRLYGRYERVLASGASGSVTPFVGFDRSRRANAFGQQVTSLDRKRAVGGLRADYRAKLADPITLAVGFDLLVDHEWLERAGSLTLPAREGDISVFGQAPGSEVSADDWQVDIVDAAPHAAAEWTFGRLSLTSGLRLDGYLVSVSRSTPRVGSTPPIGSDQLLWAVEPRLAARFALPGGLALLAQGGRYHQAPDPADLSAVFGTPTLGLSSAVHAAAGISAQLGDRGRAELLGFAKWLDDLPVRSADVTPLLAHALDDSGAGRSAGAQLLVRHDGWRGLSGWIAYAISRSERRRGDEPWRLFDHDQTHVLSVVALYELGAWAFGGRFRFATGAPRTPVVGSYYEARTGTYQPVFGRHNSIRLPSFAQLDLRIDRRFRLPPFAVEVYLEVQNALARDNAEEFTYSFDYGQRDTISGLPPLAVAGARVEF